MCQLNLMSAKKHTLPLVVFFVAVFSAQTGRADSPHPEILKKICSGSCSGSMASIRVLADKQGRVKYYRFNGSLQSCSHPPSTLYDVKGNSVMTMAEHPVDPKNFVQAKAIQKWQRLQKDLTEMKIIWCDEKTPRAE